MGSAMFEVVSILGSKGNLRGENKEGWHVSRSQLVIIISLCPVTGLILRTLIDGRSFQYLRPC